MSSRKSSIPFYLIFPVFVTGGVKCVLDILIFAVAPLYFLYISFLPRLTGNFGDEGFAGEIFLYGLFLFMKNK